MKKRISLLIPVLITAVCGILFFMPRETGSLSRFSLGFFQRLFQNDTAKEVFHLEEDEAAEVFGWESEEVFL